MAETTFPQAPIAVSLSDAAKALGITYQCAWRWLKAGKFKGAVRQRNGRHLVPASSVEALQAERQARWNKGVRHG